MKSYKPYLSLSKTAEDYVLDVVLTAGKTQTISSITQQEVKKGEKAYWGVIIELSTTTQLMNGPETPIFSTSVSIPLETASKYQTIKCLGRQVVAKGLMGPPPDEETDIDFIDSSE
ncbi:hypothetical protein [uncultured Sunxiuqinia sp.]|uniref:hypothetical protein n=1 Tax=Sunxiuqinia rutila TaxID=1397841 RepID=UPI0026158F2F|nr:hypothetical protein [uncultured Sunxiuqinia sp.]